jgi:pteridine reductase
MDDRKYPLAMITGGAHRIGRAFAITLARRGYAILLHYFHSVASAETTVEDIRAYHVPVYTMAADLTRLEDINALFSFVDTLGLQLKVLINSAAEFSKADLHLLSADEWDVVMNLNLRAPFILAQGAVKRMRDDGLIVNITDAGAGEAWMRYPAYSISKAGLEVLTRLQARTYAPGVRVNAIAPGLVLPTEEHSTKEWNKLVSLLPLKRPASTDDVTSALDFLLTNRSVTGQTIVVDCGFSLV